MPFEIIQLDIRYCPCCKNHLEELDHTTFRCNMCESQFQIEQEFYQE